MSSLGGYSSDDMDCSNDVPSTYQQGWNQSNYDRFVPQRSKVKFEKGLLKENISEEEQRTLYNKSLTKSLFNEVPSSHQILKLTSKPPKPEFFDKKKNVIHCQRIQGFKTQRKYFRHVPQIPTRVLDAPDIKDDFYLNLLDWGARNILGVALQESIYLWDAGSGEVAQLVCTDEPDYVSSIKFSQDGKFIAVGTRHSIVQIWDLKKQAMVRTMDGHVARVNALDWNNYIISSGGRDTRIVDHDVRMRSHTTRVLDGHEQEICGLKWCPRGLFLASGANDNTVRVWSKIGEKPRPKTVFRLHRAAVKALDWCPWKPNILASGGGAMDQMLYIWNANNGHVINSARTQSQVSSLLFSRTKEQELFTGHGFALNQVCLWKMPGLVKVCDLTGHTSRVLHLSLSPNGKTLCSCAGDETLRFWNLFGDSEKQTRLRHPFHNTKNHNNRGLNHQSPSFRNINKIR